MKTSCHFLNFFFLNFIKLGPIDLLHYFPFMTRILVYKALFLPRVTVNITPPPQKKKIIVRGAGSKPLLLCKDNVHMGDKIAIILIDLQMHIVEFKYYNIASSIYNIDLRQLSSHYLLSNSV